MLAESIREHPGWQWHPMTLGISDPRRHYLARYRIHRLPPRHFCHQSDYPGNKSSQAKCWCPKWFQMHNLSHLWLNGGRFVLFGEHLLPEIVSEGGSLQTKLVAKVIFSTVEMQLYHHVEVWLGYVNNHFYIWNVSYGCHLLVLRTKYLLYSTYIFDALLHLQNVVDLGQSVQFSFLCFSLHFQIILSICHIQCCVIAWQYAMIGLSMVH